MYVTKSIVIIHRFNTPILSLIIDLSQYTCHCPSILHQCWPQPEFNLHFIYQVCDEYILLHHGD